ncbi:MAG: PLP-dependent aminotransferase family protein [Pirellulaceae bacterium]|nr:PLP-dependent aminotransferase family protein [Pirellulaceae bacterium]
MSTTDSSASSSVKGSLSQRAKWAGAQPISDLMHRAISNPDLISLAAGFVDQMTLPVETTKAVVNAILNDPNEARAALQYGTTPGHAPLRQYILDRLKKEDQSPIVDALTIDQIVLTAGSNQLLHLVADSLLDPGDIVLCAAPTYFVFMGTLSNLGAKSYGVKSDDNGMDPDALEAALKRLEAEGELHRVKAVYLVSYFDNPRGVSLPQDRRERIVEIVKRWSSKQKIHILEDAAYRELNYFAGDIPSMLSVDTGLDTVVLAGTFSKSFSPGIRVGWGVLPRHLIDPVCFQKGNIDFGSPNFSQHIVNKAVEMDLYDRHVQTVRDGYEVKLKATLDAVEEHFSGMDGVTWTKPEGGLYVWLALPESINTGPSGELFELAVQEGVLYVPGEYFYPEGGEPIQQNALRLTFGMQDPKNIFRGVELLAGAVKKIL